MRHGLRGAQQLTRSAGFLHDCSHLGRKCSLQRTSQGSATSPQAAKPRVELSVLVFLFGMMCSYRGRGLITVESWPGGVSAAARRKHGPTKQKRRNERVLVSSALQLLGGTFDETYTHPHAVATGGSVKGESQGIEHLLRHKASFTSVASTATPSPGPLPCHILSLCGPCQCVVTV